MSDQWSADPGAYPPVPSSVPTGWKTQPGHLAPDGPPPFGSGPALPPLPTPTPRPRNTTRNLLIAVGVLGVLLLVVSASLVFVVRTDEDLVAATSPSTTAAPTTQPSAPGAPAPSTTAPPATPPSTVDPTPAGPAPTPEELDAEIAELSDFVERARGLRFLDPVEVVLADEANFDERLFAEFDDPEAVEGRQEVARILTALGLLDPGLDIDATIRDLFGAGVLGFYDPETGELVVRGQAITPYTRQILAHELTHALDDQHFELHRPEYDDLEDETSFGFSAVIEGSARRVETAFVDAMTPADRAQRDQEEAGFIAANSQRAAGVPPILGKIVQAQYEDGQLFVDDLVDLGGQELLDAVFDEPPTTSSQVLHLDVFLSGIGAVDVDPPTVDGEVIDEGMFGELMTRLTLEDSEDPSVATNAAAGWAGDWYVTWSGDEGASCIRIAYEMTTELDLDELEDAYTSWAAPRGATVERLDDRLEVTSCSLAAGVSPL